MSEYTVDGLLSSRWAMDRFIHNLANLKLTNMDGGAYRQVRLCYYEGGILLVSNHHVDCVCSIKLAENPSVRCVRGDTDSRYSGNAHPKPETGEWYCVWSNGGWVKHGPWDERITDLLARLIERADEKCAEIAAKREAELAERRAEIAARDSALSEAWS